MKVGRNDPCPCGSGKKYKHCCLNKRGFYIKDGADEKTAIRTVVKEKGYKDDIADVLCNLMQYMKEQQWIGACHATTAVMFVALSEMGFSPKACVGEVRDDVIGVFDHSWIELDDKIIDLACSMTLLGGQPVNAPVIFDVDIYTGGKYEMKYGVEYTGLDRNAEYVMNTGFCQYMDAFPSCKNGLWDVVSVVLKQRVNISELRLKYQNTQWCYVHQEGA